MKFHLYHFGHGKIYSFHSELVGNAELPSQLTNFNYHLPSQPAKHSDREADETHVSPGFQNDQK